MPSRSELAPSPDAPTPPDAPPIVGLESVLFRNVQVMLRVDLGQVFMSVEELLALKSGAVLKLDRALNEPVELYLNGALIARGEIVALDENFAVRLMEIAPA